MSERTVYVVDDDDAVRDSLTMLFRNAGLAVRGFSSALEFLERAAPAAPACLVLDIRSAVEAVKKGAYDFIEKPFDDYQLVTQVMSALERSEELRSGVTPAAPNREQLALLSEREQEVLRLVLAGKPSRQVAEELYISARTVEFHRARIMQKLGVRSAAELFRVCLAPTSTFPS